MTDQIESVRASSTAERAEAEIARKNEQLQEAQAHIESVLASITDTHILFDRQWRYVYVNEAAGHAIGRPRERILGRTLWELFPDIVGTELDRQYHRAMDERVPVAFDFHYPTRDTWWANRFYPTPEGLAVFATDITDRKRAEEALRRGQDELEQRVFQRTEQLSAVNAELLKEIAERKRAEAGLVALKDELAAELTAMARLHEVSTRLLTTTELQPLLEEVLSATMTLLNADFGNVQLYDPKSHALKISAQRGFQQEFLDYFDSVQEGTASCGAAMERRERVIVEDVLTDPVFAPHLHIVVAAGYRAVQSTPLFSRDGELLGMISTHFRQPHRPSERELRFIDLYARLAAEMIERKRIEQMLQEHQHRFRVALESSAVAFTLLRAVRDESAHIVDFGWLYLNPAASRILGRAPEELIGRRVREVLPDAWEPPGLFEGFVQVVHTGEPRDLEVLSRRNGIDTWFHNIAAKLDDGIAVWFADVTERRRAEEELRRSEAFLAEGQRISHTGSWAVKFPSEDVFWSEEMYRIYGLDPATTKLSQQLAFQLIHPEDRLSVQMAFERAVRDKSDYAVAHRAIMADGSIKHLHALGHPMFNESGDVIEYVGTVMDVTEPKLAEAALRRSEAYLAEGQRLSHTASWAWNISSEDLYWSEEHYRIFGLNGSNAKPTKASTEHLIHREDRTLVEQTLEKAVQERSGFDLEFRIVLPDGTVKHLHSLGHPIDNGSADLEFAGVVMDVTERRDGEAKLAESERRFRQLAESIPHHVWSFRPDSSSVGYCNQRLIDYTGLTPEEIKTAGWAALHPDDVERVKAAWEKAWANGGDYQMEQRVRGRDGRYRRFVCRGVAVKDEQGRPIEWFGTDTDVEERRRAEEALHKSQAELAHVSRMTMMGELAASIAHEINQPLGAIVNNSNACLGLFNRSAPQREVREALSDIVSDANRASAIIARIRALYKRTPPEKTSLTIEHVIADVLTLAHVPLVERHIKVRTELADDLPRVLGDRVQLQQVLLILVVNGVEAMLAVADERRVLTIGGRREELDGRPGVLITVQDFGGGFKPEDSERLFDAFYTSKPDGLGMGLRISRSIVEAHGGRLWATSNDGQGATFHFALPAETPLAS